MGRQGGEILNIRIIESMKECVQATLKRTCDEPNIYIPLTTQDPQNYYKLCISVGVRGRTVRHPIPLDDSLCNDVEQLLLELDGVNRYEFRRLETNIVVPYKDRIIIARAGRVESALTILHIKTLLDILTARPSTSKIEERDLPATQLKMDVPTELYIGEDGTKKDLNACVCRPSDYPGWHLQFDYNSKLGTPVTSVAIECATKTQPFLIYFNKESFHLITSCLGVDEDDEVKYEEQFLMCKNKANSDELSPITFKENDSLLTEYQKKVELQAKTTPDSLIMEVPTLK